MSYGIYESGQTFAHSLDPRTKITISILFMLAVFISATPAGLALMVVCAACMLAASGCTPRGLWKTVQPFLWLIVVVAIFDVLFYGGETTLVHWGPFAVSAQGIAFAVQSALRFLTALLGVSTLMRTTSPTELTDALGLMFAPLGRFGASPQRLALSLGLSLRFIPVLVGEFAQVREAQAARGATKGSGSLLSRAKSFIPALIPLFAGAFRRADNLADSMCNRGYDLHAERTCIRVYSLAAKDVAVLVAFVAIVVAVIALNVVGL